MARKILLADDSVTAQNMGRKILIDAGYEVLTVNNGSAALKRIAEAHPDLIVLDVYMPGYSGLEVCQKIKESPEGAQIPVLLTVGKLEPFKQEEARRVRADAFIIKPFEATELLAALGKLEDKLAPVKHAKESHSPASTMASFERLMTESAPKYGDEESGWKARIKIPKGTPLEAENEPAEPIAPASSHEVREEEEPKSVPATTTPMPPVIERPIPAGIPQDITPDEIAAISAAAARVSMGLSVGQEFKRMASRAQSAARETVERTAQASGTESSPATDSANVLPGIDPRPESAPAEITGAEPPEISSTATPGQPATQAGPASQRVEADAIESDNGNNATHEPVPEPATVAVVGTNEGVTVAAGHRWIAEEVPVDAQEAVLVLEREMHKAFAAFAAAEHATLEPYQAAPVDQSDEPLFASLAPPPIGSPVPVEISKPEELESASETSVQWEGPLAMASASGQDGRPVQISKPPAAPFPTPAANVEEPGHAVAAFGSPQPFGGVEPQAHVASADSSSEPASEANVPSRQSSALSDLEVAAATAAARTKWEEAHEKSPLEHTPACDLPNPSEQFEAAEGLKQEAAQPEPEAHARAAAASADSSSSSDTNLASIVDSMLAELKPKLMAELAKKLEKKK